MRASVRAVLTAVTIGAGLVPAAAATTATASSTPTAPPGYQRLRSAPIPVPLVWTKKGLGKCPVSARL